MSFVAQVFAEAIAGFLIAEGYQRWRRFRLENKGEPKEPVASPVQRAVISRTGFVNYVEEMHALEQALCAAPDVRIIYLYGPGGIGKTRLLEEVRPLVRKLRTRTKTPLRWGGILDLYHTDLHSAIALQDALVAGLDSENRYFLDYRAARERFEMKRQHGLSSPALDTERKELDTLFLHEYTAFASIYRPVIAFDTLEVLRHESDLVQSLCILEDVPLAARQWLLKMTNLLPNTVFVLAGRPDEPAPPYDLPCLAQELQQTYRKEPERFQPLFLQPLPVPYRKKLFKKLLKDAPASVWWLHDKASHLCQLTEGLPVHLALTIELATQSTSIAALITDDTVEDSTTWSKRLVQTLFRYDDPQDRLFFFLALARKGLTPDLLNYLQPAWSWNECVEQLKSLHNLVIVKVRPNSDEVFLHDVLYELFDAHVPLVEHLHPWYESLIEYYQMQQAEAGLDRETWGQATVHRLYYELLRNPRQAFEETYIRWSEVAIKGHEATLDMRLRDEFLRFFNSPINRQRAEASGLTQQAIHLDSTLRWVKRYLMHNDNEKALALAETILSFAPQPYAALVPARDKPAQEQEARAPQEQEARALFSHADSFFWGHLLTYYGEVLTFVSASEQQCHSVLEQAIRLLEDTTLDLHNPSCWLRDSVLGYAYNRLGYFLRTYGHYGIASEKYQRALDYFEVAQVPDEQANTLNNRAFVLGLLGDTEQAIATINQALAIRMQLGQLYPRALSYNTRGLIYALHGQYQHGRDDCLRALNIAKEIDEPRGIGLACNALGFLFRQWASSQPSSAQAMKLFEQAATYLCDAIDIFSERVTEPLRLWEVYSESGSLAFDWGVVLHQQGDDQAAQQQFAQAYRYQEQALRIAQELPGLQFQEADTCDDLAKICFHQGNTSAARHWLKQAVRFVPAEYRLTIGKREHQLPPPGEAHWLILGKAHWQLGVWHIQMNKQQSGHDRQSAKHPQAAIEQLALASVCFVRYWHGTAMLATRLQAIQHQLSQVVDPETCIIELQRVAACYDVDLTELIHAIKTSE